MWFNLCPWGTFGLIVDIVFLIIGIIGAVILTKWANKRGWVGEKYCIFLLIAIVFAAYACASYDVTKLKCHCDAPSSNAKDTNAKDTNSQKK